MCRCGSPFFFVRVIVPELKVCVYGDDGNLLPAAFRENLGNLGAVVYVDSLGYHRQLDMPDPSGPDGGNVTCSKPLLLVNRHRDAEAGRDILCSIRQYRLGPGVLCSHCKGRAGYRSTFEKRTASGLMRHGLVPSLNRLPGQTLKRILPVATLSILTPFIEFVTRSMKYCD